jgi:hypothetical protein
VVFPLPDNNETVQHSFLSGIIGSAVVNLKVSINFIQTRDAIARERELILLTDRALSYIENYEGETYSPAGDTQHVFHLSPTGETLPCLAVFYVA